MFKFLVSAKIRQNGDVEFFSKKKKSVKQTFSDFQNRQNSTFSLIEKNVPFHALLSKCFFLSTLHGFVPLDFEKNTPELSILYPAPYYFNI